jgi:hypothetical protein
VGGCSGDKADGERRGTKVRCAHIAIIRAHDTNVRDRPETAVAGSRFVVSKRALSPRTDATAPSERPNEAIPFVSVQAWTPRIAGQPTAGPTGLAIHGACTASIFV